MKKVSKAKITKRRNAKNHAANRLENRITSSSKITGEMQKRERSPSEKKIEEILMKNGVRFIPEYFTNYCYSWKTNHLLYFDFYLPDYKVAIEFDGAHHYKPIYGEERLKQQKYKDSRKNKYCKKHGIKLLRIPYWYGQKLEEVILDFFDKNF